jgi:hypothetical protein
MDRTNRELLWIVACAIMALGQAYGDAPWLALVLGFMTGVLVQDFFRSREVQALKRVLELERQTDRSI